jgi:hypothetical protein
MISALGLVLLATIAITLGPIDPAARGRRRRRVSQ